MAKISKRKKVFIIILAVLLCIALVLGGLALYGRYNMRKIPHLSFMDTLEYTTKGNSEAKITVGIIKDGKPSYKVYGENAQELPAKLHTYEIGSVTKTLTAAIVNSAITEGKISIDSTIDTYLSLPKNKQYPTIKELLTHTSGYKGYYFESPMIMNFLKGRNDYYGITKDMALKRVSSLNMDKPSYGFKYSNFGYAVLGLLLENVYNTDYKSLFNSFVQQDLGLTYTGLLRTEGDLGKYWEWQEGDAYIPAGSGIVSNIEDMLKYADMLLNRNPHISACLNSLAKVETNNAKYKLLDINIDEMGMGWAIDSSNGIMWHSGGTGNYNSYIGISLGTGNAVVILSNLAPSYRIPATVMGVKLLKELNSSI
ncbi:MAG: beta-lactamase family protein [Christensenellaceae bacterium]|nr:beta-lactamase family protein [Christensenellaceae bacterium]